MKLLVTGAVTWSEDRLHPIVSLGYEVLFMADERAPIDEVGIVPGEIDGVVCNRLFSYTPIDRFTELKFIQLTSAGMDQVPMDYIMSHGKVTLYNAKDVYSIPIAEFVVGGVLQLYKQSLFFYDNQKLHKWEKNRRLLELAGKTVLIIGCGSVGAECAQRFQAFGCNVLGLARAEEPITGFDSIYVASRMNEILALSDIVVLAVPLTDETYHLIDAKAFSCMKASAILVNVARGSIVDSEALVNALSQRQIGGAVLDVHEIEPVKPDNPLWDMRNVIITPHNSFASDQIDTRLYERVISTLRQEAVRMRSV